MSGSNKDYLLSVIVPVYNGEKYLESTLDSILSSRYRNLEVILVDDGSSDGSSRICQKYNQIDERIRYKRTFNGGIVSARNCGLDLAKGDYICFCDQDDQVDAGMYASLLKKMQETGAEIGISSAGRIIDGKKSLYEHVADACCQADEILNFILYPVLFRGYDYPFYNKENYLYGTLWKCIFNADFIRKHQIRFLSFVAYEDDWLFVTEALCHAQTVVTSSEIGYYWRVNTESRSHRKRFVPGIGNRFEQMDAYVVSYLEDRIANKEIFDSYRKVLMCEHYVDLFKNEPDDRRDRKAYYIEVRDYLKKSDYKKQLSCLAYLQSNAYRRRWIGISLLNIGIKGTFITNSRKSSVEKAVERIQWLARLERSGKIREDKGKDTRRIRHEADYSDSML